MLITDDFVFIHQPKTGGTFVTKVLQRLSETPAGGRGALARWLPRRTRNLINLDGPSSVDLPKHAPCARIPEAHRHKVVLATVRNPYDRYVSQYEFGWWRDRQDYFGGIEKARSIYPHFPDITFEEFINLSNSLFPGPRNENFPPETALGYQTKQFVVYFFKRPNKIFPAIDQGYIESERYKRDLFDNLHFVRTDRLNQELYDFLCGLGYDKRKLEFILTMGKVFPPQGGRSKDQSWDKYYTPELKQEVRTKERLMFSMFPEFDI